MTDPNKHLKRHLRTQIREADRVRSDWVYILKTEAVKCLQLAEAECNQSALEQIRWERDTALSQLAEIGKGLGEKMDDVAAMMQQKE